jgi:hypothetical protein
MINTIKLTLSGKTNSSELWVPIEKVLTQNNFRVQKNEEKLFFERKIINRNGDKFRILIELYMGFTRGEIYVQNHSEKYLICRLTYLKQFMIALIVGLIISVISSLFMESILSSILTIGLPFTMIYLIIGMANGNSQMSKLLNEAVKINSNR